MADLPEPAAALSERRWRLIRDVLVFQAKMLVEGVRDVLLVPLTLGAAVVGLVFGAERPERLFRDVLRAGLRFDRWLNLFGALGPGSRHTEPRGDGRTIDEYFHALERRLVEQNERGGLTGQARSTVDGWLDTLQQIGRTPPGSARERPAPGAARPRRAPPSEPRV